MFTINKKIICILFFLLISSIAFCKTFDHNTNLSVQVTYPWNAVFSAKENLYFYSHNDNSKCFNLGMGLNLSVTTVDLQANLIFSYLPFVDFFTNFGIGLGWNFPKSNYYGFAEIAEDGFHENKIIPYNFSKALLFSSFGIDLHFDLKRFVKNKWADFTVHSVHSGVFRYVTGLRNEEFWIWQNDNGENRNGFIYKAVHSLEYNMPLTLSKLEVNVATLKKLYHPIKNTKNLSEQLWNFELAVGLSFKPNKLVTLKIEPSWVTVVTYEAHQEQTYFTYKKLVNDGQQFFMFKKISASIFFLF